MNNNDERDYAEEAANRQLMREIDEDLEERPTPKVSFSPELVDLIDIEQRNDAEGDPS